MTNQELLNRTETTHNWTAKAILDLREFIKNEDRYTQEAINEMQAVILQNVQLTISEMEILAIELEGE